jgi:hypothetical protein
MRIHMDVMLGRTELILKEPYRSFHEPGRDEVELRICNYTLACNEEFILCSHRYRICNLSALGAMQSAASI